MDDSTAAVELVDDLTADPQDPSRPHDTSQQDRLEDLVARATAAYALKDYSPAAELYSHAVELQAEINGEVAVENADLLYSYGKCLYYVAVSKSDVLGGGAAGAKLGGASGNGEMKQGKKRKANGESVEGAEENMDHGVSNRDGNEERKAEGVIKKLVKQEDGGMPITNPSLSSSATKEDDKGKPYFQFTGDENWDDDSDGEDAAVDEEAEQEEEDDFVNAFEVLDLSRVLLLRKLEGLQTSIADTLTRQGEGESTIPVISIPAIREVKERIADVHDLQAEISLEGEKFGNAIADLRASLALKEELFPLESSVLAECHYKLSLALEFSSVTPQNDENEKLIGDAAVDDVMRGEAAEQMEKAIQSCQLRVSREETELATLNTSDAEESKRNRLKRQVEEVKEMIADMEQRLVELRKPPTSITEDTKRALDSGLGGVLGQILGESKEEQSKALEAASQGATDLSGLVKRRKTKNAQDRNGISAAATPEPKVESAINGTGKRKAVECANEVEGLGTRKRAKVEDADEDA